MKVSYLQAKCSLPMIARMRNGLQQKGLLYVGDCKLAALQTRAQIKSQGDYYLCPLSALQAPPSQIQQEVEAKRAHDHRLITVERVDEQGKSTRIAQGYETEETVTAQVDGEPTTWKERRLLVQSMAAALAAQKSLQERLLQAHQVSQSLLARRQGKARLRERTQVEEAIKGLLTSFRVEGLLRVQIYVLRDRPGVYLHGIYHYFTRERICRTIANLCQKKRCTCNTVAVMRQAVCLAHNNKMAYG